MLSKYFAMAFDFVPKFTRYDCRCFIVCLTIVNGNGIVFDQCNLSSHISLSENATESILTNTHTHNKRFELHKRLIESMICESICKSIIFTLINSIAYKMHVKVNISIENVKVLLNLD